MNNIEQLLNKENWIKYLELADQGGITNHGKAQDIVSKIEKAINYTRCCKSDSEQLLFSADEIVSKINEQTVLDGETFKVYFREK